MPAQPWSTSRSNFCRASTSQHLCAEDVPFATAVPKTTMTRHYRWRVEDAVRDLAVHFQQYGEPDLAAAVEGTLGH